MPGSVDAKAASALEIISPFAFTSANTFGSVQDEHASIRCVHEELAIRKPIMLSHNRNTTLFGESRLFFALRNVHVRREDTSLAPLLLQVERVLILELARRLQICEIARGRCISLGAVIR